MSDTIASAPPCTGLATVPSGAISTALGVPLTAIAPARLECPLDEHIAQAMLASVGPVGVELTAADQRDPHGRLILALPLGDLWHER